MSTGSFRFVTDGLSLLGCCCWVATDGLSLFGRYCRDAVGSQQKCYLSSCVGILLWGCQCLHTIDRFLMLAHYCWGANATVCLLLSIACRCWFFLKMSAKYNFDAIVGSLVLGDYCLIAAIQAASVGSVLFGCHVLDSCNFLNCCFRAVTVWLPLLVSADWLLLSS